MLIQFNFKNFKSFREEATLDLSAAKMTEFSDRVVTVGSEKIFAGCCGLWRKCKRKV